VNSERPVTPYHFKLKKVSGRQQRLLEALYSYLPATGVRDQFQRGIMESIVRHVGEECAFRMEAVHQEPYASFVSRLPRPALLVVFGMAPLASKAICEIDFPLALMLVERMLGGSADRLPAARELSDTEQGVLQYLILQVLEGIHRLCGKEARVHFRFERFAFQAHEIRDLASEKDGVAILAFRVHVGRRMGFVRLALPDPFVEEAFLEAEAPGELRAQERVERLGRMERFGYIRFPIWAEAGRATLSPAELAQLEEGDIVLFDHSSVALSEGQPTGKAVIRIGSGMRGGLDAKLSVTPGRASLKIVGVNREE
jgi:flagellar motor switch protein FliM